MSQPLARPPAVIIQDGKRKSEMLAEAVLRGGLQGGVVLRAPETAPDPDFLPVVIGAHPTTIAILRQLHASRTPFVYMDNGYFRASTKEDGYFRATTNALQWANRDVADPRRARRRWSELDIALQPVRRASASGDHILVPLQTADWFSMMGLNRVSWSEALCRQLKRHSARPVLVREKPRSRLYPIAPLAMQLAACHAVVGYSSNTLIEAAIAGVPSFAQGLCAASPLGYAYRLEEIEGAAPAERLEERRLGVFEALAAAQWSLGEIASGVMMGDLGSAYQPEFQPLA